MCVIIAAFGTIFLEDKTVPIKPEDVVDFKRYCTNQPAGSCSKANYLENNTGAIMVTYLQLVGTWLLMFTNLVPISLMVCLETVKFL
jgi:hypothetical protein